MMDKRPFPAYKGDDPYIFVSYAHADADTVYPLLIDLNKRDVKIWYDEGIEPGSKWREELSSAIANADKVLFLASKKSVASVNCERELDYALSLNVPVQVVYLENVELPPHLSFSLGSHQAIIANHYEQAEFFDKVYTALTTDPEKRIGAIKARQRHAGRWVLAAGLMVAMSVLFLALRTGQQDETEVASIDIVPTLDEPVRVAVRPLRNMTGTDEQAWVGDGLANLLRDQLSSSRYSVVMSPVSWINIEDESSNETELMTNARRNGIDYLISGELLNGSDENLMATVRVTNLRAGIDVMSQSYPDLSAQEIVGSSGRIATNIKQAMKIPREEQLETYSADFYTDNIAAYEAYVNGLRDYSKFQYKAAEQDMETALALSPDFHVAQYRLANIYHTTSRAPLAKAALAKIPAEATLPDRERLYIDAFSKFLDDDFSGAIALYKEILEKYPYEIEAQRLMAYIYFADYQENLAIETLRALRLQEPENPQVLGALGYQLTTIGEAEEAGKILAEYVRLYPQMPNAWELNGSLKLRLGNIDGARADYQKALDINSEFTAARIGLANVLALTGDFAPAMIEFTAIRDNADLPPRPRIDAAFNLAYVLRAAERPREIAAALDPVEAFIENEGVRHGLYWYVLANARRDLGDEEGAVALLTNGVRDAPSGGVPTRFVHARGVIKAMGGEDVQSEMDELAQYRLPDDDPDRTEDKAINHIKGLSLLARGEASAAVGALRKAMDASGYEYGIYALDLALALLADGKQKQALEMAASARSQTASLLSGEIRLDLLWYQHRAAHLEAEIYEAMGDGAASAAIIDAIH